MFRPSSISTPIATAMPPTYKLPERILVIGGCGFVGHHIVRQLVEAGVPHVSVLDLRTERNQLPGATYHAADITSEADIDAVLAAERPDAVIHTASPVATVHTPNALFEKVNIVGTQTLLARSGESGTVKAFVYTSSASVVHNYVDDLKWVDEKAPVLRIPATGDYYSHTKAVADIAVRKANRKHKNMLTACIRPAGIMGEGDSQLIPGMLAAWRAGRTNFQIGNNENYWDYTYVGNLAHAHILAVQALWHTHEMSTQPLDYEKVDGEAFFITNDEPVPFWDFAHAVWREAGWRPARKPYVLPVAAGLFIASLVTWVSWVLTFGGQPYLPFVKGMIFSTQMRTFSIEKAKRRLGYEPLVSLDEGIRRGVKACQASWEKENEDKKVR